MSPTPILAVQWPIRLEYFSATTAAILFAALATAVVLLGVRSLTGLGPVRKWVAIGIRLLVLLLIVLVLGGIRYQRRHKDLEVIVLRDVSQSTANVGDYPGPSLQGSVDDYLNAASAAASKPPDDKVGIVSFQDQALIDAMPNTYLSLDAHAIRENGTGTDISAAIQLGLATFHPDAMHRLVLVSDGNATQGDTATAIAAATAAHVPIDVMPLKYHVDHEVLLDRFLAPTWKRENEPFSIDVILKSTNPYPVTGKLTVLHQGLAMDTEKVTLTPGSPEQPSLTPVLIKVPPLTSVGVHQFHANFEADKPADQASVSVASGGGPGAAAAADRGSKNAVAPGADTLASNNSGDAFTFVRGKGQVLYVDNYPNNAGDLLAKALVGEGIAISDANHITVDQFPPSLIALQNYDAIILANVPRGAGGMSEDQQKNLAEYVHDMGGGLVMIGGDQAFGAGGWQGSKLEEVLPVTMDIPAQRQIPKGALVLVMHSCEMPDGNYWGEQCAIKALETLSGQDEIGVISYDWGGGARSLNGQSAWDYQLQPKGDGSNVIAAVKKMQLGDMPSFDDSMDLALNGRNGTKGLKDSDARVKHVIVISDGDPAAPNAQLVADYKAAKVSVSTVAVYPHGDVLPPTLQEVAKALGGHAYGPINNNPSQLPQIFIKEATVIRRSLITEDEKGIRLKLPPSSSDMVKGVTDFPAVYGMVLTGKKNSPQIEMPIVAGKNNDPILAHWQTGLGKAAVYTSDAFNRWGAGWVASPDYSKFWAQVVRGVSRPPMSSDFDIQTTQSGDKGHIVVEALNKDSGFLNFLNIVGKVAGPDPNKPAQDVRLVQTGPGRYEGTFNTPEPGTYVAALDYHGQPAGEGQPGVAGMLLSGVAMNSSPELRDLQSNDSALSNIAQATGGRVLPAFDAGAADLFTRDGLTVTSSPMPVWDVLLPFLVGLILIDVATRRIAWDWNALRGYAAAGANKVRSYTTTRTVETRSTVDALQRIREQGGAAATATGNAPLPPAGRPDRAAKFEAKSGVAGDITQVVGGATDKPIPPPPKKIEPKGATGDKPAGGMSSLLEAKRRAQEQIKKKEQE